MAISIVMSADSDEEAIKRVKGKLNITRITFTVTLYYLGNYLSYYMH